MKCDANQIVYLAFTSGTTGMPKGVMHSDNTLLANARAISHDWSIDDSAVVYSLSPLSHNLGFGALVMTMLPWAASLSCTICRAGVAGRSHRRDRRDLRHRRATHAIDLLAELRERGIEALGDVKGFRISGAAVPPTSRRACSSMASCRKAAMA